MTPEQYTAIASVGIAFTSMCIAAVVAVTARGQWATNRNTLKHQLFERRYAIYQDIATFLSEVARNGTVREGEADEFLRKTRTAHFVFACDGEVTALVKSIHAQAVELHSLEAQLFGAEGTGRRENLDKQIEIKAWFSATHRAMETTFEKYLRLDH